MKLAGAGPHAGPQVARRLGSALRSATAARVISGGLRCRGPAGHPSRSGPGDRRYYVRAWALASHGGRRRRAAPESALPEGMSRDPEWPLRDRAADAVYGLPIETDAAPLISGKRLAAAMVAVAALAAPLAITTACTPVPRCEPRCYAAPGQQRVARRRLPAAGELPQRGLARRPAARGSGLRMHPDFGGPVGIPCAIVAAAHPKVAVSFDTPTRGTASPTRWLRPAIEGGSDATSSVVDRDTCTLYETCTRLPLGPRLDTPAPARCAT